MSGRVLFDVSDTGAASVLVLIDGVCVFEAWGSPTEVLQSAALWSELNPGFAAIFQDPESSFSPDSTPTNGRKSSKS